MKNLRIVFLVSAALLLGSVAQAQQNRVDANIPFNFLVGDKAYPAGDYRIASARVSARILRIDQTDGSHTALVGSNACTSARRAEKTKLVFHRIGDNYFLYQIWIQGKDIGSEFPKSKTEIEMASNQVNPDLVVVAAHLVH
jgi:hypothetical protein